jgi:hypothetical protein
LLLSRIATYDIDGYRLDAAKHVTSDFVAYFSTEIRAFAQSIGKDNFLVVGEVAGSAALEAERLGNMLSNPNYPDDHGDIPAALTSRIKSLENDYLTNKMQPFPGLTSLYDFAGSGSSRDWLLGQRGVDSVTSYYSSSDYATVSQQVCMPQKS